MNQPQGPWGGGYQQGPPQGQGGQQAPQPYSQQPYGQQGYAPPQGGGFGGPPGGGGGGYDFGQLYGQADMSSGMRMEEDRYPSVVEGSEWGRTKDGTKGQWTIVFRTTAPGLKKSQGQPGAKLTMTLSVNPVKTNGDPNPQGLGIMYRQLGVLGIPIPPAQPFWELGWSPEQVAQAMTGRPCTLVVKDDEYDGVTRSKIRDIQPPTPGAPVTLPQSQQGPAGAVPGGQWYGPGGQPQGNYQQPLQGYQQAPAPWQPPQQPPQQGPAMDQYGNTYPPPPQQPQGYGQQHPSQQGVPGYAQPAQPGQGGNAQFTPQGQAIQPGTHPGHDQPPQGYQNGQQWQQPGQQQASAPQGGQQPQGGAPAPPPWAQ